MTASADFSDLLLRGCDQLSQDHAGNMHRRVSRVIDLPEFLRVAHETLRMLHDTLRTGDRIPHGFRADNRLIDHQRKQPTGSRVHLPDSES